MADINTSIAPNTRPEVNLRSSAQSPNVVARPIPTSTPGIGVAPQTATDQLLRSLEIGGEKVAQAGQQVLKEERQDQLLKGQQEAQKNQLEWADAVAAGKVDTAANPWFIKGYQEQDGRVAGLRYYTEMRAAYANSQAKGSDDPKVYAQFVSDFTKGWLEKNGAGKSIEWQSGFAVNSNSALSQLNAEHASQAEQAVLSTQKTNTGAEVNAILNTTDDPVKAGAAINALGEKMRRMGMPQKDFEEVTGQAILAKAKIGNGDALKVMDYVTTGGDRDATAIGTIEGSGRYDAVGRDVVDKKTGKVDRAYGKYGVMGANVGPWTQEVLGKTLTPAQFLADTAAQDQVFKVKFGQLKDKYGGEGAARAWYAGEGGMNNLDATDGGPLTVRAYGQKYATLASDPRFAAARVDTQEYLKEKARGDVRWQESRQDRQFTLENQAHSREMWQWQKQEHERQSANWDRVDKSRSYQTQIMLSTMSDPANAYAENKSTLAELAKINPEAAKEAASWMDSFTTRREKVDDAVEKPVVAQLTSDMVTAAGNPDRQHQLMMDISRQFRNGKLNKDTLMRLMDDAHRLASFDPGAARKLNSGSVVEVKKSIDSFYTKEGQMSTTGSQALDALYAKQSVDRAVLDALRANPSIPEVQLGEIATKALRTYLETTGAGELMGKGSVEQMNKQAATGAARTQGTAPAAPASMDEAIARIAPANIVAAARHFHEEFQKSPLEGVNALAEFDRSVGIPGLGRAILERNSKPPETPKKK